MKDMQKLAAEGRGGDTRVAHLTEGEVVVPREVAELRPDLIAHVAEQLRRMGGNPRQMVVGRGRVNPQTGIEEFATEEEVRAAYKAVLGRDPDAEGMKYWMNDPNFNLSVFTQAAKPELVTQAYDKILGRKPDEGGYNYWVNDPGFSQANFALAAQPELAQQRKQMAEQITKLQGQSGAANGQSNAQQNQNGSVNEQYNQLQSQYGSMSDQFNQLQSQYGSMEEQLALLQLQYNELLKQQQAKKNSGGSGTATVGGSGVVDDGSTLNPGVGGMGTTGVVYGPDGTAYSSAAAAIAAGVPNFTFVKPVMPKSPQGPGLITGADNLTSIPSGVTGNVNPGALIAGQNDQLFARPTGVQLPRGVTNPF